ncbi:MAG: recombinase RecT [Verrucomicrobiota bacterium]
MSEALSTPTQKSAIAMMADRLHISQPKLVETLKATAFKTCKSDEQFAALMIVSNEYQLNPLTKEIYAFPGKGGEVVPIVSIDGWLRIINSHPQFDGMDEAFAEDGTSCTVTIYRKDRSRPTVHTEFLDEVRRPTEPWKQHTRRMLKWKTIIQCGRIAFGFGGIYDEDEGKEVAGMRDVTPEPELPKSNPFAKPEAEPVKAEEVDESEPELQRAFFESFETQESKPGVNKPWKLWRMKGNWPDGPVFEAVTFSSTIGSRIEELEDGDEILVVITESQKGSVIEALEKGGEL